MWRFGSGLSSPSSAPWPPRLAGSPDLSAGAGLVSPGCAGWSVSRSAPDEAEVFFNRMVTREVAKFDREYLPEPGSPQAGAKATLVVVSLLLAIRGDRTTFPSVAGSAAALRDALQLVVGDVMADSGDLVVAAELLWTPTEAEEVLDKRQLVLDYPELVDL